MTTSSNAAVELAGRDLISQIWTETAAPNLEGRLATQYALANGYLGLRGTHEEMPGWASPGFYVAGTYCTAPVNLIPIHSPDHILTHPERVKPEHHAEYTEMTTMPNLPNPVAVRLTIGGELVDFTAISILACERILHMEDARLTRRLVIRDNAGRRTVIDSERFVSWANPHLLCFRYRVTPDDYTASIDAVPYINAGVTNARGLRLFEVVENEQAPGFNRMLVHIDKPQQQVTIAQAYRTRQDGNTLVLEVAIGVNDTETAHIALAEGYDAQLADHLRAVQAAYMRSHVEIGADALSRQGFLFGQMHLEMALCRDNSAVSVPIKGLTGEGYRFMVFWDTDFHLFPYYLLTNPAQARNLLLYRFNLLDAARRNARAWGYRGAQVPWETGTTGEEETAPWLNLQDRELHISADVAYAVKLYDDLTDDAGLLVDYGAEIVFETARFYASRVMWVEEAQRYELRDIGCPDQYHTFADNNVFISRMAKWNLAYAAELANDARLKAVKEKIDLTETEVAEFAAIAGQLYVTAPNDDGIIEEFDGFFDLSTDLRGISEMYCSHTQAVKQPDALLLFQPFAHEYDQQIQQKNWRYYAARTLHGSSLSLPGMALAAANAGLLDEALPYFQRSARMDLDDLNLNTNLGVHLAGYSVLWETVVFGFGGLTPRRDRLEFTPRLPQSWNGLSYAVHWRGCRVRVELTSGRLVVTAEAANPQDVPVSILCNKLQMLKPGEEFVIELAK
ncbi:MAG: glycosyl hydrolase family 65 protein [Armatimonadota bacterium]